MTLELLRNHFTTNDLIAARLPLPRRLVDHSCAVLLGICLTKQTVTLCLTVNMTTSITFKHNGKGFQYTPEPDGQVSAMRSDVAEFFGLQADTMKVIRGCRDDPG